MKAFLVKAQDGRLIDAVITAIDENDARTFIAEEGYSIGEIRQDVASVMGVNIEGRKRHEGALTRWLFGQQTSLID